VSVPHEKVRAALEWTAEGGCPHMPQGLKPYSFFVSCSARLEVVPFPVVRDCGVAARSAIKGQKQVPHRARGPVRNDISKQIRARANSQRWKRCATQKLYAAHSTSLRAGC
jgi:hypothetical protein